jgi:hypothetical protein
MDHPNPPQTLSQILATLFNKAALNHTIPFRKALGSGLQIDVAITNDGLTHFQISRDGKGPSPTEWSTVLKNLPYSVEVEYKTKRYQGRIYFMAAWPTPPAQEGKSE